MANIKYMSIKPGYVFEHNGVKLKAVEVLRNNLCNGCYFRNNRDCTKNNFSCIKNDINFPKQKHDLIFKEAENE